MNLLEHYILEIYDIRKLKDDKEWMSVDMLVACYGNREMATHLFMDEAEFDRAINNGYFMA